MNPFAAMVARLQLLSAAGGLSGFGFWVAGLVFKALNPKPLGLLGLGCRVFGIRVHKAG